MWEVTQLTTQVGHWSDGWKSTKQPRPLFSVWAPNHTRAKQKMQVKLLKGNRQSPVWVGGHGLGVSVCNV